MELNDIDCISYDNRTKAFDSLKNKDIFTKRLEKTKLCKNIINNGLCSRKFCSYAHTIDELKDPKCVFDKNCRKSSCFFKHSVESREEYHIRCGIQIPNKINSDNNSIENLLPFKRLLYTQNIPSINIENQLKMEKSEYPINLSDLLDQTICELCPQTITNNSNELQIKIDKK